MDFPTTSTAADSPTYPQYRLTGVLRDIFAHLNFLFRAERAILGIIASYAVAIGLFLLCVPIAVQELVSTFSFAMEPRMIFTLTLFVASSLTGVAAFRVLQARAVETLQQRIYTRVALGFTLLLPRLRDDTFAPQQAHRFMEANCPTVSCPSTTRSPAVTSRPLWPTTCQRAAALYCRPVRVLDRRWRIRT